MTRAFISISGLVQGIGFRPFVYRIAVKNGLSGYVKNLGDAGVEVDAEGDEDAIKTFLVDLEEKKPPLAIYTKVDVRWMEEAGYREFTIDTSDIGKKQVKLSIIPPDITVCPDCLKELEDPGDRHHLYPFTCCAICGPRYTTITDLPYDRERTTMEMFPLCPECGREFYEPLDRRYNAQTICCPVCGPRMTLYGADGEVVDDEDPLRVTARLLDEGSILAIKGIGGIHLAVKTTEDDPILTLRERRRKPGKPFAIMSRGLDDVRRYSLISRDEKELLTSYWRPIVALTKREPFPLSQHISPGLHTVGVMLPYSGIHHVLFRYNSEPALVMTSANYPGEPMFIENEVAFEKLEGVVDYLLLHNRVIHQRCDDSVVRMVDGAPHFLRRSRGYVPMPLEIPFRSRATVAAVGTELTSTAAFLKEDKCYLSQHLGDIEGPESLDFLEGALGHIIKLLRGGRMDAVALDLPPQFLSRQIAERLREENDVELVEIQHHHAHLASVMADNLVPPDEGVVGVICDGYGYGVDGGAWGGEILVGGYCEFRRVGHLESQPMPGGDLSAIEYGRMLQGILYGEMPDDSLGSLLKERYIGGFSHGEEEVDLVFRQLERGIYTPWTTSAGRLLDAVSCLLGASHARTYEGEGAMKLESLAEKGSTGNVRLPVEVEDTPGGMVLRTTQMVMNALDLMEGNRPEDIARGFQVALSEGLAEMAVRAAQNEGLEIVGFSGGVANNHMITRVLRERVEGRGLKFIRHRRVPSGDGGVSLGQAASASIRVS